MGQHYIVARLYKSAKGADYLICPQRSLTASTGDFSELRLDATCTVPPSGSFAVSARISRSLTSCLGCDPYDFLLEAGTWLAITKIEAEQAADLEYMFNTANTDATAGPAAALSALKHGTHHIITQATETESRPGASIFLSYSSRDKDRVYPLADALRNAGIDVWIDRDHIQYGHVIQDKIDAGLKEARYFGFVITPNSLSESPWLEYEQSNAWQKEFREGRNIVIPMLLEGDFESIPEKYSKKKCADLRPPKYETELAGLVAFLRGAASEERPGKAQRGTDFPLVTVGFEATEIRAERHQYQLGLRIENIGSRALQAVQMEFWFANRVVAGAEGFGGLGGKGPESDKMGGYRWDCPQPLFVGQELQVCPTRGTMFAYAVDDKVFRWIGKARPHAEFRVFADDFPPLAAQVPFCRLQIF